MPPAADTENGGGVRKDAPAFTALSGRVSGYPGYHWLYAMVAALAVGLQLRSGEMF